MISRWISKNYGNVPCESVYTLPKPGTKFLMYSCTKEHKLCYEGDRERKGNSHREDNSSRSSWKGFALIAVKGPCLQRYDPLSPGNPEPCKWIINLLASPQILFYHISRYLYQVVQNGSLTMSGSKYKTGFAFVLISLFSIQAFSQQINYGDSLNNNIPPQLKLKPILHYSVGSTFIAVPHSGSFIGFTATPELSIPLSPKLSVDGGIIAGRYYSNPGNIYPEGTVNGAFSTLSVYGSASYHFNSQLTLYGAGIRQLAGPSQYNLLPKSSYTIGSTYNFGSFSIGVAVHMSNWNSNFSPFPVNGSQGLYSPFGQRYGAYGPFIHWQKRVVSAFRPLLNCSGSHVILLSWPFSLEPEINACNWLLTAALLLTKVFPFFLTTLLWIKRRNL